MKILDTDILAALLRKKKEAVQKLGEIEESKGILLTTVFNAQELLFGALISENYEDNFRVSKELMGSLEVLDYDKDSMQQSVKAQAYLEKKGQHIGLLDEMIVGIALARDATLVTRNVRHFSRIQNLRLEKW